MKKINTLIYEGTMTLIEKEWVSYKCNNKCTMRVGEKTWGYLDNN